MIHPIDHHVIEADHHTNVRKEDVIDLQNQIHHHHQITKKEIIKKIVIIAFIKIKINIKS